MDKFLKATTLKTKTDEKPPVDTGCIWRHESKIYRKVVSFAKEKYPDFDNFDDDRKRLEYRRAYHRLYLKKGGEKRKQANQKYYKANKDKIYEQQKQWRRDNREKHLKHLRDYAERVRRKAGIKPRISEKTLSCACGGRHTKANLTIHAKTKRHRRYIANLESKLKQSPIPAIFEKK